MEYTQPTAKLKIPLYFQSSECPKYELSSQMRTTRQKFQLGCLRGSVGSKSNSPFWLRSGAQGLEISRLRAGCEACLRLSLSPSFPPDPLVRMRTL